ncbi:hypothetical protein D3C72_2521150 [compost metagenome]
MAKLQLVNAGNKLYREVGLGCARPSAPAAQGEETPKPDDTPPVEPEAPAAP